MKIGTPSKLTPIKLRGASSVPSITSTPTSQPHKFYDDGGIASLIQGGKAQPWTGIDSGLEEIVFVDVNH